MPGLLYLADTNILLRLIKSNDPEFPLIRRAALLHYPLRFFRNDQGCSEKRKVAGPRPFTVTKAW